MELVNTLAVDTGEDQLANVEGLRIWGAAHGYRGARPTEADRSTVIELREALRRALLAHHDHHEDPEALAAVQHIGQRHPFHPGTSDDGTLVLVGDGSLAGAVVADMVGAVLELQHTGRWMRLKVCPASDCLEAFEDETRSATRRWCSMEECGNRAKVGTYRRRTRNG